MELLGIENLRGSYPHQISGGQQQRVALARQLHHHQEYYYLMSHL